MCHTGKKRQDPNSDAGAGRGRQTKGKDTGTQELVEKHQEQGRSWREGTANEEDAA